jgi:hypothetical protein
MSNPGTGTSSSKEEADGEDHSRAAVVDGPTISDQLATMQALRRCLKQAYGFSPAAASPSSPPASEAAAVVGRHPVMLGGYETNTADCEAQLRTMLGDEQLQLARKLQPRSSAEVSDESGVAMEDARDETGANEDVQATAVLFTYHGSTRASNIGALLACIQRLKDEQRLGQDPLILCEEIATDSGDAYDPPVRSWWKILSAGDHTLAEGPIC